MSSAAKIPLITKRFMGSELGNAIPRFYPSPLEMSSKTVSLAVQKNRPRWAIFLVVARLAFAEQSAFNVLMI